MHQKFGDMAYKIPPKRVFAYHPDYINQVLKTNAKNYQKGTTFEPLQVILGNGLVNSEGDTWKNSRRIVGNEFNNINIIPLFRAHD